MVKPEQIPKEVVEAMARNRAIRNEDDDRYWPDYADGVEADLLAGLNAWPGSEYVYKQPHRLSVSYSNPAIILPLPQENSDDQA